MNSFPQVIQPIPADHALEFLTNSMWSTMMITGMFFMSFLFVFLSIKVKRSVGMESIETGIRYIHNHVKHHLFETPLLPRRRFSSLSLSWFSELLKRASFSTNSNYAFTEEISTAIAEKSRRNSSHSEHNTSRRSSTSSKSKRMSVPNVQGSKTNNNTPESDTTRIQSTIEDKAKSVEKLISRRNTLPNIALSSELPKLNHETNLTSPETVNDVKPKIIDESKISKLASNISNLNVIAEEEESSNVDESSELKEQESLETISDTMPMIEEEENNVETDECESLLDELVTEHSGGFLSEECECESINENNVEIEKPKNVTESITIPKSSIQSQSNLESSSPKTSSFRSAYLNYLPESIFGYSTGISKTAPSPISPSLDAQNAPPGFSKRSASHDFSNSPHVPYTNEPNVGFNMHQPLYARRRTETATRRLSDAAKSFFPSEWTSKFQSAGQGIVEESRSPSRSNSSSPCLIDLQNTEDLFAPINWNFSVTQQNEELRRNWDVIEETEYTPEPDLSKNPNSRRQSTPFSSPFDGY